MARSKSKLPEGLTQLDYSSMRRIKVAFGSEQAIRTEYSRMRDIIQKRIGRLEAADETHNIFYNVFGKKPLPTARGTSTRDLMLKMASMARALSGAYASDLSSIRAGRKHAKEQLAKQAEKAGDLQSAREFKELTDIQYEKIKIMMGILENVLGRGSFYQAAAEEAVYAAFDNRTKKDSVRSLAIKALRSLGISTKEKREAVHSINFRWTSKGKTKVNWKKLRNLR